MHQPRVRAPRPLPPKAELLLRGLPVEILQRIADGDPLDLRTRVTVCLERRCLLLDPDRLLLLALADVAREARLWTGRPALARWLAQRVEVAVDRMLVEEARMLEPLGETSANLVQEPPRSYGGLPAVDEGLESLGFAEFLPRSHDSDSRLPVLEALARPLGLSPEHLRRACAAFNARPETERRAFDRLVLCRDSLDELAQQCGSSVSVVGRRARRALDAVMDAVVARSEVDPASGPAPLIPKG